MQPFSQEIREVLLESWSQGWTATSVKGCSGDRVSGPCLSWAPSVFLLIRESFSSNSGSEILLLGKPGLKLLDSFQ